MIRAFLLTVFFILGSFAGVLAQGTAFGIKAGLNFSSMKGPSEFSSAELGSETSKFIPGFHLGPTFTYDITDKVGLQVELLYSQKGNKYRFSSETGHYRSFLTSDLNNKVLDPTVWAIGDKSVILNVNTGHLALPVMFFYNITSNLRLGAGLELNALLHATGNGQLAFEGQVQNGPNSEVMLDRFTTILEYNYNKDKAGAPAVFDDPLAEVLNPSRAGTSAGSELLDPIYFPQRVKAYFLEAEKNGRAFNLLDLGANVDLAYVFNSGLYFNLRGSYGLLDSTNNTYDFSEYQLTDPVNGDLSRVARSDKDASVSIQVSVGFTF